MSFYYANARQPEILRTVQKDLYFTNNIGHNLSDILRFSNTNLWIKYNHLCTLFAELAYHGFACSNNLQTLGEEYTGIIQMDNRYITLPNKLLQFMSILMEFAGEKLLIKLIKNIRSEVERNNDLLPGPKARMLQCCQFMLNIVPYVKAIHRTWFYLTGRKYQISRRITGINYVLIRYWLNVKHSVYGYKVLGLISFMQLSLVFGAFVRQMLQSQQADTEKIKPLRERYAASYSNKIAPKTNAVKCVLCLEERKQTSATLCGHLFCWPCILDWLDQKEECPVCREHISKSSVVYLMNLR